MEEWKDIEGYEGYYQVSTHGRVKRLRREVRCNTGFMVRPERILKTYLSRKLGYLRVTLSKESEMRRIAVHKLVVGAFMTNLNPEIFTDTNHIDGDKTRNYIFNLELCTRSYNQKHAYKTGLKARHYGDNNPFHGRKHTSESKEKMSAWRKGKKRQYREDGTYTYA